MSSTQRRKLDKLTAELLGRRLAVTTDPLARAQLKEAIGVPLDYWSNEELRALAELLGQQLTPAERAERAELGAELQRQAEAEAQRLAAMTVEQLAAEYARHATAGARARDPQGYQQRMHQLQVLLQSEAEQLAPPHKLASF